MRTLFTLLVLLVSISLFQATSESGLKANTIHTTSLPQATILNVIKLAAYEFNCTPEWLYEEYQAGGCTISLLDSKNMVYVVELGGVTTILIDSSLMNCTKCVYCTTYTKYT